MFTDSVGQSNVGLGPHLNGQWAFLLWQKQWADTNILRDITFFELVPTAWACFHLSENFRSMRIQFSSNNMAVVQILNSKASKSGRGITQIVLWSLQFDFQFNVVHISGVKIKLLIRFLVCSGRPSDCWHWKQRQRQFHGNSWCISEKNIQ